MPYLKYVLLGDLCDLLKPSELKTDGLTWHGHAHVSRFGSLPDAK